MFKNVGVRIELIPVKDFFGDGGEGILIWLYFFRLDIAVIFLVPIVLIVEIGKRGVVTEAFVMACALLKVAVHMLEVDAPAGNHCDFFWYRRDRKMVGSNRRVVEVAVVFWRIDALRDEVLFLGGIVWVFMLPWKSVCQLVFFTSPMFNNQVEFLHVGLPSG